VTRRGRRTFATRVRWIAKVLAASALAGAVSIPVEPPALSQAEPPAESPAEAIAALGGEPAPGPAVASPPDTAALLGAMGVLVGLVAEPAQLAAWAEKIDRKTASLDGYLDEILGTERFAGEVVPALMFASFVNVRNYYALPVAFILKHPDAADGPLYLRAPCSADEAVTVRPWWDLRAEVKVCPDSYRPDKWTLSPGEHSYRTAMALSCDSQVGSPELETASLCGCGPNLIRCMRDDDQYNQFNKSFMDEVKRTTAYVVEHDLAMASLFTSNATFRDRNTELYYRRQKIETLQSRQIAHELADLDAWPQAGQWARRDEIAPGQHAGVLTTPQLLHWLPDRRQRQRGYYEMMWCNLRNSFGATTHKVLELNANGNNFFVHDSWQRLAHTELCMNCHARLDYGSQFFLGFPDSRAGIYYNPALQASGTGQLYGRDIRDPRGQAPLTPLGFANLATAQPDFNSCMTSHFVNYVLGDRATGDDVQAIEAVVVQTGTFKAAMKVALERYAQHWRDDAHPPAPAVAAVVAPSGSSAQRPTGSGGGPTPDRLASLVEPTGGSARPGPGGGVTVGRALRVQLDEHCVDCHDEAAYSADTDAADLPFSFKPDELPRRLLVSMTDQVAFGMMPKNQPLDPPVRDAIVELLIDTLWAAPAERSEARRYYLGRARGLPAHQVDNELHEIDQIAGASSDIVWGALERGIWADQSTVTPSFLALSGLEALRACAHAVQTRGGSLESCLAQATAPSVWSRRPPAVTAAPARRPP